MSGGWDLSDDGIIDWNIAFSPSWECLRRTSIPWTIHIKKRPPSFDGIPSLFSSRCLAVGTIYPGVISRVARPLIKDEQHLRLTTRFPHFGVFWRDPLYAHRIRPGAPYNHPRVSP
ncbi:hypothetical protein AB1N83_010881 [Pleurotus pulmonarius]